MCCLGFKCPMVHHRSTNMCPFRFCSIFSSVYCSFGAGLCAACMQTMGDNSWQEVNSWVETVNTSNGQVVHSTYGDQQAGQAAAFLCLLCCIAATELLTLLTAGGCWLFSTPGLCLGNNEIPPNDDLWMNRCVSVPELLFRLSPAADCKGSMLKMCECCFFAGSPDRRYPNHFGAQI